jgi:hypothetical protein
LVAALLGLMPGNTGSAQTDGSVKIHGHWKIDVRRADGALVSHVEFENALAAGTGAKTLVQLLSRKAAQGYWEVDVYGGPNDIPCQPQTPAHLCIITEPAATFPADAKNLTVTSSASGDSFTLAGSVKALHDANILWVATAVHICPVTSAPKAPCNEPSNQVFTTARTSPAISVSMGQEIQVTVTFGYS